jgi:hypothetical protein
MKMQLLAAAVALGLIAAVKPVTARASDGLSEGKIKHVLLISIDGLHALDVANYVSTHPGSAGRIDRPGSDVYQCEDSRKLGFVSRAAGSGDGGIATNSRAFLRL